VVSISNNLLNGGLVVMLKGNELLDNIALAPLADSSWLDSEWIKPG
jgi:hypothetical protein